MERKKNGSGDAPGMGTAPVPSMANGECWDSVSYLESAFHHGFMRLRLKTGDFVYHENPRLTRELDEFCDVDAMHTPKGPVILLGESGMGKSAFLANWLVRRKKMFQNWQSSYPEFIFSHVVGCSRQSCSVSNLLERILREIKEYFELSKDIPDVEERLSWQFPRFLEAASKKGRVILVVDGLQRLHTTDGESILKWVPLAFPPNVRIIFSGTVNYPTTKLSQGLGAAAVATGASQSLPRIDKGAGHHGAHGGDYYEKTTLSTQMIERIKVEAGRRNWKLLNVLPLNEDERWRIVKKFLHKHRGVGTGEQQKAAPGLQLFEIQQKAIVSVPMSASPQFLKNFLASLLWAVKEGFNVHAIFESWLSADSVGQLLEAVLRSMEMGHTPDEVSTNDAMQFLLENREENDDQVSGEASIAGSAVRRKNSVTNEPQRPLVTGRRASLVREDSRQRVDMARAAMEAAARDSSVGPVIDYRPRDDETGSAVGSSTQVQRVNSVHETKEIFVSTTRGENVRGQGSVVDGNGVMLASVDSLLLASGMGGEDSETARARTTAAHNKLKRFPTEPRTSRSSKAETPDYLLGGRSVAPLRELLGRTQFAVLTEARGTNQMHESASPEDEVSAFGRPASKKSLTQERLTGFSEDEWQALLRALRTLGILFVQEVVVLPLCKDILRDVIWWRYIGSERAEQHYHQWLIRFFRIHPTTFRRVEELPWHLKRCYQWDALRQVLVNLPMFQLLYTANYKTELFGYWKVLTDGPLLNYGAAVSPTDPPVYVLPFDVVKEYGKSLDEWYRTARPPTKSFTAIVQLITRFMHEFCLSYQGALPRFVHAPFDLKRLYQDGFLFVEELPHVQTVGGPGSSSSSTSGPPSVPSPSVGTSLASPRPRDISSMGSASVTTTSALLAALDNFPPPANPSAPGGPNTSAKDKEMANNAFFFYQRWVWIQFPWLALGREIVVRDPVVANPILEKANGTGGGDGGNNSMTLSSSLSRSISSDALAPLGSSRGGQGEGGDEERRRQESSTKTTANTPAQALARSGLFDARFWDVKKSMFDPMTRRPRGQMTSSQLAAIKNASVLMPSAVPPPITQALDVISPEKLFRKKSAYATVRNVLGSSVRRLPTAALQQSASLPTLPEKRSTTFLTDGSAAVDGSGTKAEAFSLDANGAVSGTRAVRTSSAMAAALSTAAKRESLMATKELALDSLDSAEELPTMAALGLPAHFQDHPESEWELKQAYNHRVVLKLQTLYDAVKTEVTRRQTHLQEVKRKIRETARRYEVTMRECDMAKHAADEMASRRAKLEHMVKLIDRQEKTHRKLIRGCELFPACAPAHFETCKKELRLLQMKVKDLQAEKKALGIKKTHLQTVELPALRRAVDKNKQLLSAVVDKLERAREKVAHDQAATDKLYQRRLEMIESVRASGTKGSEATLEEEARAQARRASSATTRSLAAKVALQQCESMVEKIQKATGFSKMELILQKFMRREELNASFDEQAKLYEARLKQIKLNQHELEEQLHSLELSQAATSTEDPRVLEQKLRAAEVELARTEYTQTSLLTSSKEVIAGAARIVKLMGITSCSAPHQNAIPAARLWPPPVGYEGESSLTSEFETLDPPAITQLLQICQDRATLMIDAIEGARSDPDMNFSLIADASGRGRRRTMRGEDKVTNRMSRLRRPPYMNSVSEKKDRLGFDRGAVPPLANAGVPVAGLLPTMSGGYGYGGAYGGGGGSAGCTAAGALTEPPGTPELDDEDVAIEVLSRDTIKASSKSRLAQKKRAHAVKDGGNNAHHGAVGDPELDA